MNDLWYQIGITPAGALGVVIASTIIYSVFAVVVSLWWRHFRTTNTAFAFALTVVLGADGRPLAGLPSRTAAEHGARSSAPGRTARCRGRTGRHRR